MRHAKLLPNLAQIARCAALVLHDAGAADHFQVRDSGEVGEDFILHAVGEISVLFITAEIFERKHCNTFLRDS